LDFAESTTAGPEPPPRSGLGGGRGLSPWTGDRGFYFPLAFRADGKPASMVLAPFFFPPFSFYWQEMTRSFGRLPNNVDGLLQGPTPNSVLSRPRAIFGDSEAQLFLFFSSPVAWDTLLVRH